jgi:hypothetical protein
MNNPPRSAAGAAADDIARRVGGPQRVLAVAAREEVDAGTADDPVVPPAPLSTSLPFRRWFQQSSSSARSVAAVVS